MDTMIKQSIKPQANRATFYLMALVILGFGVFAEHFSDDSTQLVPQAAQIISIDQ